MKEGDHIELIWGELIQMAAKGTANETCIIRLLKVLSGLIGDRATLRCQSPLTLMNDAEPDFSIVKNREDDCADGHPTSNDTLLIIEISDSSLEYDREVKLSLYAEANIHHYWLFNLSDRYLETYCQPCEISPNQFGYLNRQIVTSDRAIAFPRFPEQVLHLQSVFPT